MDLHSTGRVEIHAADSFGKFSSLSSSSISYTASILPADRSLSFMCSLGVTAAAAAADGQGALPSLLQPSLSPLQVVVAARVKQVQRLL
uniref:Uncharacterized protein n=1 Tax=Pristionchus pacificus TaxID=54126 RepID=A0A2A6C1E9_PRIPA|eukprot:PDM71927.1 hypothetical protein PRIPAC_38334 [Pristionchus pacificus]